MNKIILLAVFILFTSSLLKAQDDKVKFSAYSRALQQNNQLGKSDTTNIDRTNSGHVLLDLGLNINPDKRTEIQAIVRFKSNLGGFFGSGTAAQLRQMYVRGLIGKYINYQVGDLYLQLTPFTFFNNNAEGSVNEARVFSDIRRDYTNYENFSNRGNYWWQQGVHSNFAVGFKETFLDSIRVDGFFLRNRASNYLTIPSSFHTGGKITITQSPKLKIAANYVNLYDDAATVSSKYSMRNPVTSFELDYKIINNEKSVLKFSGEGGFSQLVFHGDTVAPKKGYFYEAGLKYDSKSSGFSFKASYLYVSTEFYSSAAQSKRINYGKTPSVFPVYGNDPFNLNHRTVSVFDIVRDTAVYNASITRQLMAYNPIMNNSQPYGKATPNRTGLNFAVQYKDSAQKIVAGLDASYLTEVAGTGSALHRKFMVVKGELDFNIHKFLNYKKRLIVTTGIRYESTKRAGTALEQINLTSTLIDLGLEIEVFKKFDVLAGSKMLMAKGNEFMPTRNQYNDVINFTSLSNININQNVLAFGLKYRFSERTYITIQDHIFKYKDNTNAAQSYSINQFMILFNMKLYARG